jgi:hypothetical protein
MEPSRLRLERDDPQQGVEPGPLGRCRVRVAEADEDVGSSRTHDERGQDEDTPTIASVEDRRRSGPLTAQPAGSTVRTDSKTARAIAMDTGQTLPKAEVGLAVGSRHARRRPRLGRRAGGLLPGTPPPRLWRHGGGGERVGQVGSRPEGILLATRCPASGAPPGSRRPDGAEGKIRTRMPLSAAESGADPNVRRRPLRATPRTNQA